jgi:hypothetical protein
MESDLTKSITVEESENLTSRNIDHSLPLDVHRWSEHPEVHSLIDYLWDSYFSDFDPDTGGPGRRPLSHPKRQLKVLILDLFVAWKTDPELSIGISMSNRGYVANSRYNALHISPVIIQLVHRAHESGLFGLWRGDQAWQRNTRIWAAEPLQALFAKAKFGITDIIRHRDQETIVLNDAEGRPMEYDDTPETIRMREGMKRYNELLHHTFVDIPSLDYPVVVRQARASNERDTKVRIDQNDKFSRRIFYRGQLDLGGRNHGGYWQRLPEDIRAQLHINDVPVIEDDYSGTHIALLYGMEGVHLEGDAYTVDLATTYTSKELRGWIKTLSLVTINADDKGSAFRAFRQKQLAGSPAKRFTNRMLQEMLMAFEKRHPSIARHFCSDKGVELMAVDGRITASIIDQFTAVNVPVITVFDSYIIDMYHAADLRSAMREAMDREVPGAAANIERMGRGADDIAQGATNPKELWNAWVEARGATERSAGYQARLNAFFDWRATLPGFSREEILEQSVRKIAQARRK